MFKLGFRYFAHVYHQRYVCKVLPINLLGKTSDILGERILCFCTHCYIYDRLAYCVGFFFFYFPKPQSRMKNGKLLALLSTKFLLFRVTWDRTNCDHNLIQNHHQNQSHDPRSGHSIYKVYSVATKTHPISHHASRSFASTAVSTNSPFAIQFIYVIFNVNVNRLLCYEWLKGLSSVCMICGLFREDVLHSRRAWTTVSATTVTGLQDLHQYGRSVPGQGCPATQGKDSGLHPLPHC